MHLYNSSIVYTKTEKTSRDTASLMHIQSARFASNPILDFINQKSGQSVKLPVFFILVSRDQQTAYSCLKIQAVETENE